MTTKTADMQKSTGRLQQAIRCAAIVAIATSAVLCSVHWLGVQLEEGDNNRNAALASALVEIGTEPIENIDISKFSFMQTNLMQGGDNDQLSLVTDSTKKLYAGSNLVIADSLSVTATETKNDSTKAILGKEGMVVETGSGLRSGLGTLVGESESEGKYNFTEEGYVSAIRGVHVRTEPSKNSEILTNKGYNVSIAYALTDDEQWYAIDAGDGKIGYIASDFVSDEKVVVDTGAATSYDCFGDKRKSFMSYRTLKSWKQYDLQQMAVTTRNGIRMYDGRYCVAIGQSYGAEVGTYFDVVLSDGTIIPCIMGDAKNDLETMGGAGYVGMHGDTCEFIVDPSVLPSDVKLTGDMSEIPGWGAKVSDVIIYQYNVFEL